MPPQDVFSGILNLIHQAAYQGYSLLEELPQPPSNLAQPCAPTITDIPPSIPTVQDLVSPSNLPKGCTFHSFVQARLNFYLFLVYLSFMVSMMDKHGLYAAQPN